MVDTAAMQAAVSAAAAALPAWRGVTGAARAEYLYRWAAEIEKRADVLSRAVAREVGKPIGEAGGEVARCAVILRYYAGEAVRVGGDVVPAQAPGMLQFVLAGPVGVVGLITPWNFPLAIPVWKAAPALAFGNTVVLKPSERASWVAGLLAECAVAAGIPAGVFNVAPGGPGAGAALLGAEPVRAISFTGSGAAGARVSAACAERNIRCQAEMGGKNVAVVLEDADLRRAARLTAAGAMRFAGQKCTATSRVVIMERVADEFHALLDEELAALALGPAEDAATAIGPLITAESRQRVLDALAATPRERLSGGHIPDDARLARGFFVQPAVARDVDPDSPLAQEELFGPVLASMTARSLDEALELANRTRYGLSASLFTQDLGAALKWIDRIEVGMVRVNGDTTGVDPHAPFGGLKASGSGSREQGSAAREFYTTTRTVQVQA